MHKNVQLATNKNYGAGLNEIVMIPKNQFIHVK